ncbi:hypothetical protein DFH09DRAFT_1148353 [Mycena vulgaris]|nr:hypothetical protein DFH09DRAFT_1148353 [Mycena vulgaris]
MHSFVEQIPYDVLQHIALLGAPRGSAPPVDLCCFLATSRALYDGLNLRSNPHLYAAIFKLKFDDISARNSTHWLLTDSSLAAELVQRCRALRRCRLFDLSIHGLRQDLWTLLWMAVEEGPCDPLAEAAFPAFIVELARYYLREDVRPRDEIKSLVIWLLCLGLTRDDILAQNPEVRGSLLALLRPFVSASASSVSPFTSLPPMSAVSVHPTVDAHVDPEDERLTRYNSRIHSPALPPTSEAAIILTFALYEAVPLQIPYHLPATRALAAAENRAGPTAEDYTAFQRAGTVLFSDIRTAARPHPSTTLSLDIDPWIADVLTARGVSENLKRSRYPPGTLTGVWEGSLMISFCVSLEHADAPAPSDFLCRTPMQCQFSEYFSFSPGQQIPLVVNGRTTRGPRDSEGSENLAYYKFTPGEEFQPESGRPVLDHILIGQTLQEHEDAWGPGFNIAGRVHDDGLIVFTRQPKNDESEMLETWVFEGHLRYGTALVGTFRSSSDDGLCGVQGIFSMRKRADTPMQ